MLKRKTGFLTVSRSMSLLMLLMAWQLFLPVQARQHSGRVKMHSRPVVVATNEWPPYVESGAPDHGLLSKAIIEIFKYSGFRVKFAFEPWNRAKQQVREGKQDVLMPAYCSPDRVKAYLCSKQVVAGRMVLFHRADLKLHWQTVVDLKPYNIGATLGYYYGPAFDRAERSGKLHVVRIPSDETNMRLLMKGRIQLYPQDEAVGYAMIRQLFPRSKWHLIVADPRPLHKAGLHLLFSRATPRGAKLLKVFNQGLEALQHNGRLGTLLDELDHPRKLLHQSGADELPRARP